MMLQSHVLAALLLGLVLSRWKRFTPRDWALALGFSAAIDLDHLVQMPMFLATHGTAALTSPGTMLSWGHAWQGIMHTPWALVLVIPFMVGFRSAWPLVFWLLHMFQDFVIAAKYVVWGSAMEWWIDLGLVALVALVFALDHRAAPRHEKLSRHVLATFGLY